MNLYHHPHKSVVGLWAECRRSIVLSGFQVVSEVSRTGLGEEMGLHYCLHLSLFPPFVR